MCVVSVIYKALRTTILMENAVNIRKIGVDCQRREKF